MHRLKVWYDPSARREYRVIPETVIRNRGCFEARLLAQNMCWKSRFLRLMRCGRDSAAGPIRTAGETQQRAAGSDCEGAAAGASSGGTEGTQISKEERIC